MLVSPVLLVLLLLQPDMVSIWTDTLDTKGTTDACVGILRSGDIPLPSCATCPWLYVATALLLLKLIDHSAC